MAMLNYPGKLIEVSLPLEAINEACVREKFIRTGPSCQPALMVVSQTAGRSPRRVVYRYNLDIRKHRP